MLCEEGYYLDNDLCVKHENCKIFTFNSCIECESGHHLNDKNACEVTAHIEEGCIKFDGTGACTEYNRHYY